MADWTNAPSVDASEARQHFAEVLRRVAYGSERIVIRRHGRAMAALVAWSDLERLQELEDLGDARAADATRDETTVSLDWAKKHRGSARVPADAVRETPAHLVDRAINIVVQIPERILDTAVDPRTDAGTVRDAAGQLVRSLEVLARHSNIEIRPIR